MSEYVETHYTDANGQASTTLEEGEYELIGSATGYDSATVTVTLDSAQSAQITLAESEATPSDYTFEHYLSDGEYTLVAEHPDYWARVETVSIDAPLRQDFTLQEYGDGVDTSGLTSVDTLTTASDGSGRFDAITSGEYVLEFEHADYKTKTVNISHDITTDLTTQLQATDILSPPDERETSDPREPPAAGSPEGYDPNIGLPAGDPHFEMAVLDTDAGGSYQISVLVSNTGGETGATDLRLELDSTGEIVDTRDVTLVSGGVAIINLSVRSAVRRVALPASVTVSTLDDAETFDLTSGIDPREITDPGIPTTLGGDHTLGSEHPWTLGPTREPFEGAERDFPDEGWALTLEQPNGDRRELTSIVSDPDIEDVHSKMGSWSVTVPADRTLEEWELDVRAYLTRDGDLVNIGWCDSVEHTTDGSTTTLSGPGPFGDLPGDETEVEIVQMTDWRAARYITEQVAPEWDWRVLRTTDPLIVRDEAYSGNPLSIIESFCKDYSLHFRPSRTHFRSATIFEPGGVASSVDLNPLSVDMMSTSEGYANEVVFAYDDGEVREADEGEIRRIAETRDLRLEDARKSIRVEDDDVDSERKARERAKAVLRDRIMNYENGGTIEMPARRIQPGLAYPMPGDDETWHGARAARLDGSGGIDLPTRMASRLSESGGFAIAVKLEDWEDITDDEGRLIGIWGSSEGELRTRGRDLEVRLMTDAGRSQSVYPFERRAGDVRIPESGWYLIHADWKYDATDDMTTVRAGNGGEIITEAEVGGALRLDDVTHFAIGRFGSDLIREVIVDEAWFFDVPQSSERYAQLASGGTVPSTDVVAHYELAEERGVDTAYDSVGGWHGNRSAAKPAGRPTVLESASHDLTTTTADFERSTTYEDFFRAVANR